MKLLFNLFILLSSIFFFASCNEKIYFTPDIRNKIESKNIDLRSLQYFIDNDIMFKREISSDTTKIISGKVIFENLKYYQVIALRADTKGVCTAVYPDRLMLSFEVGDNKNIVFSIPKSQGSYDVYQMMKEDIYGNPTTTIMYDGHIYNMILKYNFLPRLMIRKRVIEKQDHDSRIMKGRSIN